MSKTLFSFSHFSMLISAEILLESYRSKLLCLRFSFMDIKKNSYIFIAQFIAYKLGDNRKEYNLMITVLLQVWMHNEG